MTNKLFSVGSVHCGWNGQKIDEVLIVGTILAASENEAIGIAIMSSMEKYGTYQMKNIHAVEIPLAAMARVDGITVNKD